MRPRLSLALAFSTALALAAGPDRVRMKEVGQPITGSLVEDVYAYDRVVLPAGTRVNGDFTPCGATL